jgi:hypothetical protein
MGECRYSSTILDLGTSWGGGGSGQLHATAGLPSGKEPPYPLRRRLGGPQIRSGRCGEKKNLAPIGNRSRAVQPVARRYTD